MRKLMMLLSVSAAMFGCDQTPAPSKVSAPESAEPVVAARGTSDQYIPLVAVAYADANYGGARRYFYIDENNLANQGYNDVTSSVKVYKGPQYNQYKATYGTEPSVAFCPDANGGGACTRFTVGEYPTVSRNDWYSSVVFNLDPQLGETATPRTFPADSFQVKMICRLFGDANYGGRYMDIFATPNQEHTGLANFKDHGVNDFFSSIQVQRGPSWSNGDIMVFYADKNYGGAAISAACANGICKNTPSLKTLGWNDRMSSSKKY